MTCDKCKEDTHALTITKDGSMCRACAGRPVGLAVLKGKPIWLPESKHDAFSKSAARIANEKSKSRYS